MTGRRQLIGTLGLLSAVLLHPLPIHAQASGFLLPPGNVVPNYDRVPIGQREGLEAGAFIARTDDAGSPWYNPAGLALSEKSGLNASANTYELIHISLEGDASSEGSTRFAPVGTYFGGVIGAPIVKSDRMRLGFYYAKPVSWNPSTLEGYRERIDGATSEYFEYASNSQLSVYVPGIAAGWRLSDRFRLGGSLAWAWTHLQQDQAVSDVFLAPGTDTTRFRNLLSDGQIQALRLTVGAQWDVSDRISVGAKVVAPGLRTGGSGLIVLEDARFDDGGSTQLFFRDESARFEYAMPLEVAAGISFRRPKVEAEVNVRYHASAAAFDMISTTESARQIVTRDGTPSSVTRVAVAPITEGWRSVVNAEVGGSLYLNRSLRVHAGFFSDASPVADPATSLFRSVDLYGLSTGLRLTGAHLSGSVGLAASWGTTKSRDVGPSLGGETAETRVRVRTLTLLYSLAYAF